MEYRRLGRTGLKVMHGCQSAAHTTPGPQHSGAAAAAVTGPITVSPPLLPSQVSVLSYGAWVSLGYQIGVPETKELIAKAYDSGVNL